ncbi:hypothetical protein BDF19DRAFT_489789 [Syncephalis fuscata]|nr:hypothetical protein BDF19DRAFT_489789 [Syncephalis fuscata]
MECDMQLQPAGPVGTRLNAMLQMVCNSRGINLDHAASLDQSITSAGLHCIGREVLHVPVGAWAGVTGEIVARVLLGQIFSNFEDSFLRLGLLEDSSKLFSTDATFNTNNNKSDFISTTYKDSSDFGLSTESWAMPDMMTAATPGTCPTSSTDICATGLSGMTLHTVSEESSLTSANSESSSHMPQRIRWDAESRAANLADLLARFTKEVDDRQTHLLMHVFVAQKKA